MLGYVIEPVALRRGCNVSFDSIKFAKNELPHNYGPKVYKPEEHNCQMNELMFQAGPRCKRNERAKRAHSLYYIQLMYFLFVIVQCLRVHCICTTPIGIFTIIMT